MAHCGGEASLGARRLICVISSKKDDQETPGTTNDRMHRLPSDHDYFAHSHVIIINHVGIQFAEVRELRYLEPGSQSHSRRGCRLASVIARCRLFAPPGKQCHTRSAGATIVMSRASSLGSRDLAYARYDVSCRTCCRPEIRVGECLMSRSKYYQHTSNERLCAPRLPSLDTCLKCLEISPM